MKLYFVNGSRQKKLLLESDYSDDIFDGMIGFFEEHEKFPHFLKMEQGPNGIIVSFESSCESFLVEDASDDEIEELRELVEEY